KFTVEINQNRAFIKIFKRIESGTQNLTVLEKTICFH
ncbi:unnamed protein product, partial [Larinioides sclopetarius]